MIRRPPRSTLFPTRRSSDLRFHRPDVGAVAGVVKVGNHARNLVTRWQALEYVTQIGVDRSAAALMNAVMVIPGACAAWRTAAVLEVGGDSDATLGGDCHLTPMPPHYGRGGGEGAQGG